MVFTLMVSLKKTSFKRVKTPTSKVLNTLVHKISQRVAHFLTNQGLLVEDIENSYLNLDELAPEPIQDLLGHSITYRIAIGAKLGRNMFTLQTLPQQIVTIMPIKWLA
jgi:hypothetical protein